MPAQPMTCSDGTAHQTVCCLYGQLLITKPLDSVCLYLVLSPSWLWVSSGLQKGLFLYLGCHSLHPWRDKGHHRLSVFITHQTVGCFWELRLICWCLRWQRQRSRFGLWLNLDFKQPLCFFPPERWTGPKWRLQSNEMFSVCSSGCCELVQYI